MPDDLSGGRQATMSEITGLTATSAQALRELARQAFFCFREARASTPDVVVTPSVPILFFGDIERYMDSARRVVTVGLNPSLAEFPRANPFRRFAGASDVGDKPNRDGLDRYLLALQRYFRECPYSSWFSTYEPLLEGLDSSFYDGLANTALHTDICTPVATDPTWSKLPENARLSLIGPGMSLWHELVRCLRPHVILLSVARQHLGAISLEPTDDWTELVRVDRTNPYIVERRRFHLDHGATTLAVFGKAAQNPFGLVTKAARREIGAAIKGVLND